jgi:hypothetical protein
MNFFRQALFFAVASATSVADAKFTPSLRGQYDVRNLQESPTCVNFVVESRSTGFTTLYEGKDPFNSSLTDLAETPIIQKHSWVMADYSCQLGVPLWYISGENMLYKPDGSVAYTLPPEFTFLNKEMKIDQSSNHLFTAATNIYTGRIHLIEASPNSDGVLDIVGSIAFPKRSDLAGIDLDLLSNEVWVAVNVFPGNVELYKYTYPLSSSAGDPGTPIYSKSSMNFIDIAVDSKFARSLYATTGGEFGYIFSLDATVGELPRTIPFGYGHVDVDSATGALYYGTNVVDNDASSVAVARYDVINKSGEEVLYTFGPDTAGDDSLMGLKMCNIICPTPTGPVPSIPVQDAAPAQPTTTSFPATTPIPAPLPTPPTTSSFPAITPIPAPLPTLPTTASLLATFPPTPPMPAPLLPQPTAASFPDFVPVTTLLPATGSGQPTTESFPAPLPAETPTSGPLLLVHSAPVSAFDDPLAP